MTIYEALDRIGVHFPESTAPIQVRCPFHKGGTELRPSARIYPATQSMYCWTCHRSFNAADVLTLGLGITKGEALRITGKIKVRPSDGRLLDEDLSDLLRVAYLRPSNVALAREAFHILEAAAKGGDPVSLREWVREVYAAHLTPSGASARTA